VWYCTLAPLLGMATRHLSTDAFLTRESLRALLASTGYGRVEVGAWTFIPKGDMPGLAGWVLEALAALGRVAHLDSLRGGLWACAWAQ
jgi:2-polyprenyl-6-hydroxyphenyl methylase/3-demethylubiquinone-9 3-methyltransferase